MSSDIAKFNSFEKMIIGIGTDIIEIARIRRLLDQFGKRMECRLFTEVEQVRASRSVCRESVYAKRFAAKEALMKALGTGLTQGISWQDITVSNTSTGQPTLQLTGKAAQLLQCLMPSGHQAMIHLSLSDTHELAQAMVVIEARPL